MKGIFNAVWFFVFWTAAVLFTMFIGAIPLAALLFFTYAGAQGRAQKAEKIVRTTLMKDEQILTQTIQHR